MMFYIRPYHNKTEGQPITHLAPEQKDTVIRGKPVAEITR